MRQHMEQMEDCNRHMSAHRRARHFLGQLEDLHEAIRVEFSGVVVDPQQQEEVSPPVVAVTVGGSVRCPQQMLLVDFHVGEGGARDWLRPVDVQQEVDPCCRYVLRNMLQQGIYWQESAPLARLSLFLGRDTRTKDAPPDASASREFRPKPGHFRFGFKKLKRAVFLHIFFQGSRFDSHHSALQASLCQQQQQHPSTAAISQSWWDEVARRESARRKRRKDSNEEGGGHSFPRNRSAADPAASDDGVWEIARTRLKAACKVLPSSEGGGRRRGKSSFAAGSRKGKLEREKLNPSSNSFLQSSGAGPSMFWK